MAQGKRRVPLKNEQEQMRYNMCASCKYDFGDFPNPDKKCSKGYRGCRRYLDTGLHLDSQPYVDAEGAHCEYYQSKTGRHDNDKYGLRPLTVKSDYVPITPCKYCTKRKVAKELYDVELNLSSCIYNCEHRKGTVIMP